MTDTERNEAAKVAHRLGGNEAVWKLVTKSWRVIKCPNPTCRDGKEAYYAGFLADCITCDGGTRVHPSYARRSLFIRHMT